LNRAPLTFVALALLGLIITLYITYEYLTVNFTGCNVSQYFSCGGVYRSGHTTFFGIPLYALGLFWFSLLLALGLYTTGATRHPLNAELYLPILLLGDIFTIYLWYEQIAVIGAICPLCVSTYIVNYAMTVVALISLRA
jgi:uncharacterized membrane protein